MAELIVEMGREPVADHELLEGFGPRLSTFLHDLKGSAQDNDIPAVALAVVDPADGHIHTFNLGMGAEEVAVSRVLVAAIETALRDLTARHRRDG